jgi:hypothetical protein
MVNRRATHQSSIIEQSRPHAAKVSADRCQIENRSDAIRLHTAPASGENLRRLGHCIFPETQGRWNAFCMKCRPKTPEKPDKKIIIV